MEKALMEDLKRVEKGEKGDVKRFRSLWKVSKMVLYSNWKMDRLNWHGATIEVAGDAVTLHTNTKFKQYTKH